MSSQHGLPSDGLSPSGMLDSEQFRSLAHEAVDIAAEYLATLPSQPVYQRMPSHAIASILDAPLPAAGNPARDVLETVAAEIMPYPMGNGHPRFFGWVNSPPDPIGIVAELLAATMNPSCAGGDHAAIYLERTTVRWLMELVGYPTDGSMGILVSGGSMASLTCLAAARHQTATVDGWSIREEGFQGARPPLIMYVSSETHTTVIKAAELLGIGSTHVRMIPADRHYRFDPRELARQIARDRADGLRPFCVVGSAGTVNTGAIDPLDELADLCGDEGLWLHVDGAYGGVGILDERRRDLFRGMERADSLAIDPHKWLSVPVECGCAMVRTGALLRDTFSLVPPYIRVEEGKGIGGLPWYSEYGFQQSRGFRALKTWMTLAHSGRDGLARVISRHNDLAASLVDLIRESPDLELVEAPVLSIVCFRYHPRHPELDDDALNAINKRIMEDVQSDGTAFLTQAVLRGTFALRANILHFGTTVEDLDTLVSAVLEAGARATHLERASVDGPEFHGAFNHHERLNVRSADEQ